MEDVTWACVTSRDGGAAQDPNTPGTLKLLALNGASGRAVISDSVDATTTPMFASAHPKQALVYVVGNRRSEDGNLEGAIATYAVREDCGRLRYLGERPTGGVMPLYVTVDHQANYAFVANYGSGSVAMLPLANDGSVRELSDLRVHKGSSVHRVRQQAPHAHSIGVDPSNGFALAPDLGADRVFSYRIDTEGGRLDPVDPAGLQLPPGSGPRHLDFHPSLPVAYVVNEMRSTIAVVDCTEHFAALRVMQIVSTIPDRFRESNTAADIHVTRDGRFVFASNRGHDSLAIYGVERSGRLSLLSYVPSGGRCPQNFAIAPRHGLILVGNKESDTIVGFAFDEKAGTLDAVSRTELRAPTCIRLLETSTRVTQ